MITVDVNNCIQCEKCVNVCPLEAIVLTENAVDVDNNKCMNCGICIAVCTHGALINDGGVE